jgi:hypothetical protein
MLRLPQGMQLYGLDSHQLDIAPWLPAEQLPGLTFRCSDLSEAANLRPAPGRFAVDSKLSLTDQFNQ